MTLNWTDNDGVKHEVTQEYATELLQQLFEEWPGGIEEINSSVEGLVARYKQAKTLLDEVMANPSYLTDSYYRDIGREFEKRYKELCK